MSPTPLNNAHHGRPPIYNQQTMQNLQNKQSKKPYKYVFRKEFEDVKLDVKNTNSLLNYSLVRFAQIDARIKAVEVKQCKTKAAEILVCVAISVLASIVVSLFF